MNDDNDDLNTKHIFFKKKFRSRSNIKIEKVGNGITSKCLEKILLSLASMSKSQDYRSHLFICYIWHCLIPRNSGWFTNKNTENNRTIHDINKEQTIAKQG